MTTRVIQYLKLTLHRATHPVFVLCVVISFGLLYINKLNHIYSTTVTIPVKIENSHLGELGVIGADQFIDCQIQGKGYQLLKYKLFNKNNVVKIDINNIEILGNQDNGKSEVSIPSLFSALSYKLSDIKIQSVLTRRFEIITSPLMSKKVPIVSRILISAHEQFIQIGETRLEPCSIEIKSLKVLLDTLERVYTKAKYFNNVDGSLSGVVELEAIPNVNSTLNEVEFSARLEEYTEIEITLPVEVINLPDSLIPIVIPEQASLRVNVSKSKYTKANTDHIKLYVNYNDRHTNIGKYYKVYPVCEDGIYVRALSPSYVELLFELRK